MKKIIWIPALIVVFFLGDRIGGFFLGKLTEKSNFRYSRMYHQDHDADAEILLLGNSRGLSFHQPTIESLTGKSSFNFSYNGMPTDMAEALVKDFLDKFQKPEVLLIDVTLADRNNPSLIAGMAPYAPLSDRLSQLIKTVNPTAAGASKLSHLFRYNSEIWQRAMRYLKGSDEDWINNREINSFLQENAQIEKALDFTFSEEENIIPVELLQPIKRLIEYAEQNSVRVELVVNPYYPSYFKRAKGFDSWKKNAESILGKRIHDYSLALEDPKLFVDYQHCNLKGSEAYINLLLKDGLLK